MLLRRKLPSTLRYGAMSAKLKTSLVVYPASAFAKAAILSSKTAGAGMACPCAAASSSGSKRQTIRSGPSLPARRRNVSTRSVSGGKPGSHPSSS